MKEIIDLLIERNETISTMESCTGGAVVNSITNIEGASNVIKFSAITYSNEFKIKMGVSEQIIKDYTVYSKEVSNEMSKAISHFTDSDYGIGITGKLNRVDENNPFGLNDQVFISIYKKKTNKFYNFKVKATKKTREENKKLVIKKVEEELKKIMG